MRLKWWPELRHHGPQVPIVILGTKKDIRDKVSKPVTHPEGLEMAREIRAAKYLECSAITQKGIQGVFEEVVRVVTESRDVKTLRRTKCILL